MMNNEKNEGDSGDDEREKDSVWCRKILRNIISRHI